MNDDIRRRIKSARALLDELKEADIGGGDFDELCALASQLEFQVAELEADLSVLEAVYCVSKDDYFNRAAPASGSLRAAISRL